MSLACQLLDQAGVEWSPGPPPGAGRARIGIAAPDLGRWAELRPGKLPDTARVSRGPGTATTVHNNYLSGTGHLLFGRAYGCEVGCWEDQGGERQPIPFDIDIVYTWVDGEDPGWRRARDEHLAALGGEPGLHESAFATSRYRNRDELRYSLRSVQTFADFVRRIFIVTAGQVPPWLDTAHEKISLVSHLDIFSDPAALPTFNSHAIESRLHHIDGLAEHYLYMNDDFLFCRKVLPETFFRRDGNSRIFYSPAGTVSGDPPRSSDPPADRAAKNNRALLRERFEVDTMRKLRHAPYPQVKRILHDLERVFPSAFDATMHHRFRHPRDISVPSSLYHHYAELTGRAVPAELDTLYFDVANPGDLAKLGAYPLLHESRRPVVLCVNEVEAPDAGGARRDRVVANVLRTCFPYPSDFER